MYVFKREIKPFLKESEGVLEHKTTVAEKSSLNVFSRRTEGKSINVMIDQLKLSRLHKREGRK